MLEITKKEAEIIRRVLPGVFISTTSKPKKSNRKKRYMEESRVAIALLKKIRNGEYKTKEGCDVRKNRV